MAQAQATPTTAVDFRHLSEEILRGLKRDRDRQILSRRFGFGMSKRQTLERIGQDFNITRERVRQIEKAAMIKLRQFDSAELRQIDEFLVATLAEAGGVGSFVAIANVLGVAVDQQPYLQFLAQICPGIAFIDEDDDYHAALSLLPAYDRDEIKKQSLALITTIKRLGQPTELATVATELGPESSTTLIDNLARINKRLASFDGKLGLASWPEVNPRSIRDKTFLVLMRHGTPLHFSDIATHIRGMSDASGKQNVTVQAVHNELIKDPRFILIGRGIYALAEWGYSPGTVADIIADVLRDQAPLHKDEIIKRVLDKRQVKMTTIILNLQEKDQFVRVAKATYTLKKES